MYYTDFLQNFAGPRKKLFLTGRFANLAKNQIQPAVKVENDGEIL